MNMGSLTLRFVILVVVVGIFLRLKKLQREIRELEEDCSEILAAFGEQMVAVYPDAYRRLVIASAVAERRRFWQKERELRIELIFGIGLPRDILVIQPAAEHFVSRWLAKRGHERHRIRIFFPPVAPASAQSRKRKEKTLADVIEVTALAATNTEAGVVEAVEKEAITAGEMAIDFSTFSDHTGYKCSLLLGFFGGAGVGDGARFIGTIDPDQFLGFEVLCADTDANNLMKKFKGMATKLAKWVENKVFRIHQLGGNEITKGRGAGGDRAVGRLAAQSDVSKAVLKEHLGKVNQRILVGSVTGGSGAAALKVSAELSVEAGFENSTLVIAIVGDPGDGPMEDSAAALKEIQDLVPTIAIHNSYLREVQATMTADDLKKFTTSVAYERVSNDSTIPMLRILRAMIQDTGDTENLDEADWMMLLKHGHYVFFGLADVDREKLSEVTAQQIVDNLFAARFQDPAMASHGDVIALWWNGPFWLALRNEVKALVKRKVSGGDPKKEERLKIHEGIKENVTDGKNWVGLVTVAKNPPGIKIADETADATPDTRPAITVDLVVAGKWPTIRPEPQGSSIDELWPVPETAKVEETVVGDVIVAPTEPAGEPLAKTGGKKPSKHEDTRPAKPVMTEIHFRSGGIIRDCRVTSELAGRFNAIYNNIRSTKDELDPLFDEVESATKFRPDMPMKGIPTESSEDGGLQGGLSALQETLSRFTR